MNVQWKDFLMSLLNATLVLGIVLAVAGIFFTYKVQSLAADVLSDVKFALMKEIDTDIKDVALAFKVGEQDLRRVAQRLDEIVKHPEITLTAPLRHEVQALTAEVKTLNSNLVQLSSSHEALSDRAVQAIASAFAEAYIGARKCRTRCASPLQKKRVTALR